MSDQVRFIFKTLIKVPIYILVAYGIMNVFAFFFIYFKVLGTSYIVMQMAVENNYLPVAELNELYDYVDNWNNIPMCNNAAIIIAADDGSGRPAVMNYRGEGAMYGDLDARTRKQYGRTVTCGVRCDYTFVWPLSYRETMKGADYDALHTEDVGVDGFNGGAGNFRGFKDNTELQTMRDNKRSLFHIDIMYTVPGLKYYPDMLTY